MIKKYRYGAPFDTEALTEKIETAEGAFPYGEISQNDGFAFTYIMDEDDIVYGLGESNRGINKEVTATSATVRMIQIIQRTSVLCMEHTILLSSGKTHLDCFLTIRQN